MSGFYTLTGLHPKAVFLRALMVETLLRAGHLRWRTPGGGLFVAPEACAFVTDEPQPMYFGKDVIRLLEILRKREERRLRRALKEPE